MEYLDHLGPELGLGQAFAEKVFQKLAEEITKDQQQGQQDELTNRIFGATDPKEFKAPERRKIFHVSVSHKDASS